VAQLTGIQNTGMGNVDQKDQANKLSAAGKYHRENLNLNFTME
jgi:hypothetical protein